MSDDSGQMPVGSGKRGLSIFRSATNPALTENKGCWS